MSIKPPLNFIKMHGLGNDVVIIDARTYPVTLNIREIRRLANRNLGVGFDQILVIKHSDRAFIRCEIFNADGSVALQCGNGLRCLARYLHESATIPLANFDIETQGGIFPVEIPNYAEIRIAMGKPTWHAKQQTLKFKDQQLTISRLSLGNPHAILKLAEVKSLNMQSFVDELIHAHIDLKDVNIGFMEIQNPHQIYLRTYERGAGETKACGSNASAAVTAGIANQWLASPVTIHYEEGKIIIEWAGGEQPVFMIGPAERVFSGQLDNIES